MPLQTDQHSDRSYFVKLFEISDQQPMLIQLLRSNHRELTEEEEQLMDMDEIRTFSVPRLLLRIDKTTDISQALKTSSLAEDASPAQKTVILNRLESLQKQLP